MNNFKVMMNGIIKENPTFVLLLGVPLCGRRVFSCKSSGQVDPM